MATLLSLRYAPDAEHAKTAAIGSVTPPASHANVSHARIARKCSYGSRRAAQGRPRIASCHRRHAKRWIPDQTLSHSLDASIMP